MDKPVLTQSLAGVLVLATSIASLLVSMQVYRSVIGNRREAASAHYEGQLNFSKDLRFADLSFEKSGYSQKFYILTDEHGLSYVDAVEVRRVDNDYVVSGASGPATLLGEMYRARSEADLDTYMQRTKANASSSPLISAGGIGGVMEMSAR